MNICPCLSIRSLRRALRPSRAVMYKIEIRKENILNCLINSQGKVLLDEEPTSVDQIHRVVGQKLRENDKLIVSVKAHQKTSYKDYVRVIDQLKMADAKRISIANSNE